MISTVRYVVLIQAKRVSKNWHIYIITLLVSMVLHVLRRN